MTRATTLLAAMLLAGTSPLFAQQDQPMPQPVLDAIAHVESDLGARVGVAVLDTGADTLWSYAATDRFPLNSTFKAFACGALLAAEDRGEADREERVVIAWDHLVSNSPVLERRVEASMSYAELCAATLSQSDNAAANLVVARLGGPEGVTAFMRSLGNTAFSLDNLEPDMNLSDPTRTVDATTPLAVVQSLETLLLGDALSPDARATLIGWMENNAVSGDLLRAALPEGWRIADRSGAAGTLTRSVIAMVTAPDGTPVMIAIYIDEATGNLATRSAGVARIGAAVLASLAQLQ